MIEEERVLSKDLSFFVLKIEFIKKTLTQCTQRTWVYIKSLSRAELVLPPFDRLI